MSQPITAYADQLQAMELPPLVERIVELIGIGPALKLFELRGGTHMYVPNAFDPSSGLSRLLGPEAAAALIREFPGETLVLPRLAAQIRAIRDAEIIAKWQSEAYTVNELALQYQLTARRIWQITSRAGAPEDKQRSLF